MQNYLIFRRKPIFFALFFRIYSTLASSEVREVRASDRKKQGQMLQDYEFCSNFVTKFKNEEKKNEKDFIRYHDSCPHGVMH